MAESDPSILDQEAISGCYLFPQSRRVREPFVVDTGDVQLRCYRRVVDEDAYTIAHFHGNGEAVADYVPEVADEFERLGLNSLFVEYRQYGGSTGRAQLVAMLGDGDSAIRAAQVPPEKVIAFGRSIGSLYAIELASRQPIAGLILESGIAAPAERFLAYAALSDAGIDERDVYAAANQYFNHREKLGRYTNPLLLLHTEHDGMVEISHAERNYDWAASSDKRFIRFPAGDHNSIMAWNRDAYFSEVASFVQSLGPAGQ